jgi:NitT/TauT family transport system ATP-binding protein
VLMTDLGRKLIQQDMPGRKAVLREQLLKLGTFRFLAQILTEAKDHQLSKEIVQEELVMRLPSEDVEKLFEIVVGWGRFAELFDYSQDTEVLALSEAPAAAQAATPG